jgi:hypothetical protein
MLSFILKLIVCALLLVTGRVKADIMHPTEDFSTWQMHR